MGKVVKDFFTEKDGVSACPVRILFGAGFALIILFTSNDVIFNHASFIEHAESWIKAVGDYIGMGGLAVAGKNFTEKADGQ